MIPNMPACEVAIDLGLHGPVTASALACASGNAALLDARRLILSGEADVVVAGGTDGRYLTGDVRRPLQHGARCRPTTISRSAPAVRSPNRDGFVYGEGAVLFGDPVRRAPAGAIRRLPYWMRGSAALIILDALRRGSPESRPTPRRQPRRRPAHRPRTKIGTHPRRCRRHLRARTGCHHEAPHPRRS